jgi:hypothetical protein
MTTQTAPYGSSERIVDFLERFRATGLGGAPINSSLLSKLSMGREVARRVLHSLKELELVDSDGSPTATLVAFEKAPAAEYKKVLANHLFDYYAPVFAVLGRDPATWTPVQVDDQFREFTPKTLRERMVRCFIGLCEYSGIVSSTSPPVRRPGPRTNLPTRVARESKPSFSSARVPKKQMIADPPIYDGSSMGIMGATESVWATFSAGGTFVVAFSGRITDLTPAERDFVFDAFDSTKAFGEVKSAIRELSNKNVQ